MDKITIGLLTVSDRCSRKEAVDESGPCLTTMIGNGVIKNGVLMKTLVVPDEKEDIIQVLMNWCEEKMSLILTIGGTGLSPRDVTPEATRQILEKMVPGIPGLMLKRSLEVTPFAALSRGVAGIVGKTLVINLPGSKKASKECLEAIACIIPHAVNLIRDKKEAIEEEHAAVERKKSLVIPSAPGFRTRNSSYPCVSVSQAQEILLKRVFLLLKEKTVRYEEAAGHVLAQDVVTWNSLPPFNASLKDGYAVLSSDNDKSRKVIGVSLPGNPLLDVKLTCGSCVRVSTGAAVPSTADAVVMVEHTVAEVAQNDKEESIIMRVFPSKGTDIRPLGSDFKMGEKILSSKTYLDAAAVGLLAAAGVASVRVYCKPVVAVLSTGDEIVSPEKELPPGKVWDSNRIFLINLLAEENFKAVDLGIAPDEPDALRDSLERGFRAADVVVTTGSMSMGERDYLKEVLVADFNAEICFGRVFMKPGKPTAFGIVFFENRPKLWFGLPGNPASAFVTSHLLLLPALRRISAREEIFPLAVNVNLQNNIKYVWDERPQYLRGFLTFDTEKQTWHASVKEDQNSSNIKSCVHANCLIEIVEGFNPKTRVVKAYLIGKLI